MDRNGFDGIAKAIAGRATRRTVVAGAAGGGLAAVTALLGVGAAVAGPAAERRRRRCRKVTGVPQDVGGQANGSACTAGNDANCASGFCTDDAAALCAPCPTSCAVAGGGTVCCPTDTFCSRGACRVQCRRRR